MTREELDERLNEALRHLTIDTTTRAALTGRFDGFEGAEDAAFQSIKQLIRDCIEAVTPEERVAPDVSKHPTFFNIANGHNQAIDTIEANTKELLG